MKTETTISVLIADDELIEREGISLLLRQSPHNFQIMMAQNGEAAMKCLEQNHIDLLFTDIKMPFMDGLELLIQAYEVWQVNTMLNYQLSQYQTVISSFLFHTQIRQCLNTEHINYFDQYLMFSNTLEPAIDSIVSSHSNVLNVKIYTNNQTLKDHSKYLYSLENSMIILL